MATTTRTAPLHAVPTATAAPRTWIAPVVAAGIGTVAALATAWWVAGLELSMRIVGY
jgi:hypothetical protein